MLPTQGTACHNFRWQAFFWALLSGQIEGRL